MMRRCDGTDPNLLAADGKTPCACGLIFDDVRRLVIHPHRALADVDAKLALLDKTAPWPPPGARHP